jgi:hypothetical protein
VSLHEVKDLPDPLHVAELGAGAHPDRYDGLFARLLKASKGRMDWVDFSPHMLELAEKYLAESHLLNRKEVMRFVQDDLLHYLETQPDASIHLAILKYTAAYLPQTEFEKLFHLLARKLAADGSAVATYGYLEPTLGSRSTNAKFFLNGESIPEGEISSLKNGDAIGIKFFKVSGKPESGFLEGAESMHYYYSPEYMKGLANKEGLDCFVGNWKERLSKEEQEDEAMDQGIVILKK